MRSKLITDNDTLKGSRKYNVLVTLAINNSHLSISRIEVLTHSFNLNVNNIYSSRIVMNTTRNTLVVLYVHNPCEHSRRDLKNNSNSYKCNIDIYIYIYICMYICCCCCL